MVGGSPTKVELRLFFRQGSDSSEAAVAALSEYFKLHLHNGLAVEYVNLAGKPELAASETIVIVPTLTVKVGASTKMLVKGLFPYATLKETLDGLLQGK